MPQPLPKDSEDLTERDILSALFHSGKAWEVPGTTYSRIEDSRKRLVGLVENDKLLMMALAGYLSRRYEKTGIFYILTGRGRRIFQLPSLSS